MRSHYDFSGGVRGKYAAQYAEGTVGVVLDADVEEVFSDSVAATDRMLVGASDRVLRGKLRRKDVSAFEQPIASTDVPNRDDE